MSRSAQAQIDNFVSQGLSSQEVVRAYERGEKNIIASKPIPSDIVFFLAQFKSPLILVLLTASLVTALIGDFSDTVVIFGAVLLNTLLGFYQERKAFKSMQALKDVVAHHAWVMRDGKKIQIDTHEIVVGDVVLIAEGDTIPADGVFVESSELVINEAVLTGESVPVTKVAYKPSVPLRSNKEVLSYFETTQEPSREERAYLGTVALTGLGTLVVTAVGMDTEMGHIAVSIDEQTQKKTPLEKRIEKLAELLTVAIVILALFIFAFGLFTGKSFTEMFVISVALAVSAIPEGLVVALTAILAIGMHRILKRKALVRNLVATETLGTVTRVCVDKTGTLTKGKLVVAEVAFTDTRLAYITSVVANELRDPLEFARWKWATEYARQHSGKFSTPTDLQKKYSIDDRIPFSSERRFLAVRSGAEIFIVGAPETVVEYSSLAKKSQDRVLKDVHLWAQQGKRVVGMAHRKCVSVAVAKKDFAALAKGTSPRSKVKWLGLMGYTDPVRTGVKAALEKAEKAGIKVTVITGDYRETAIAVMNELGMNVDDSQIIEGHELEKMSDFQLESVVQEVLLFARTKPSQKLRIVKALQAKGEVVAMMGDGVNDAPAIAAAEIGLVVGDASDIARESADIVLLDSNFATILAAVEEGRGIFANLRKIILFLLSDTFSEVILIMGSLLLGLPLAITAAQILWINIVNDVFPNLALTMDPKQEHLLEQPPIDQKEEVVNGELKILIILISLITGLSTLAIFSWSYPRYGIELARTLSFAILAIDSLVYVFSCRTVTVNVWKESVFANKWLVMAVLFSGLATIIPIYFDPFKSFFNFQPLEIIHWIIVAVISVVVMTTIEITKYVYFNVLVSKQTKM